MFLRLRPWVRRSKPDSEFAATISSITSCKPKKLALYHLALRHRSANGKSGKLKQSNERLEYLGDAILGAIVAEYLYDLFPDQDEGFLTSMRAKIVSRNNLNQRSEDLGIPQLIVKAQRNKLKSKSLHGNALEALIGAVYLDCGYGATHRFVREKIIQAGLDLQRLSERIDSHKSALLEWAQKNKQQVSFDITGAWGESHAREFQVSLSINGDLKATALGKSKKSAEEEAAKAVYQSLRTTWPNSD